jgi:hypothetical protein
VVLSLSRGGLRRGGDHVSEPGRGPQTRESPDDVLATLEYVRKLSYVDPKSIVVNGTRRSSTRTPRPAVAENAFEDVNALVRRHLPTKPSPIDPTSIKQVPFEAK